MFICDVGRLQYHFLKNQKISDKTVRKSFHKARNSLYKQFHIDQITCTLREQNAKLTPQEKSMFFNQIKVECLSRLISALYICHLALLLHRIEINIIGRYAYSKQIESRKKNLNFTLEQMGADDLDEGQISTALNSLVQDAEDVNGANSLDESTTAETNFAFLSSTRYLLEEGIEGITRVVCDVVARATAALEPQHPVTLREVKILFKDIIANCQKDLIDDGNAVGTVLPDDLNMDYSSLPDDAARRQVKVMLEETRDYLESEVFRDVCLESLNESVEILMDSLTDIFAAPKTNFTSSASNNSNNSVSNSSNTNNGNTNQIDTEANAPHHARESGVSLPLAKLFAKMCQLSDTVLASSSERHAFIEKFASLSSVEQFSSAIFCIVQENDDNNNHNHQNINTVNVAEPSSHGLQYLQNELINSNMANNNINNNKMINEHNNHFHNSAHHSLKYPSFSNNPIQSFSNDNIDEEDVSNGTETDSDSVSRLENNGSNRHLILNNNKGHRTDIGSEDEMESNMIMQHIESSNNASHAAHHPSTTLSSRAEAEHIVIHSPSAEKAILVVSEAMKDESEEQPTKEEMAEMFPDSVASTKIAGGNKKKNGKNNKRR